MSARGPHLPLRDSHRGSLRRSFAGRLAARLVAVAASVGLLGACSVVSSDLLNEGSRSSVDPSGVYYSLPMGLVDIQLFVNEDSAEFRVVVGDVVYIADPAQRYLMRYRPLPNYDDAIEIAVSSRSLISKVWATTEDKTDEIVVELAKAFQNLGGGFQSAAPAGSFKRLAGVKVDPSLPEQLRAAQGALGVRAQEFARQKHEVACGGDAGKSRICADFARWKASGRQMIRLAVDEPPPADTQVAADCTVGLCYRVKEPFLVRSLVDGIPSSEIVYLPNKVPLIEIDVRRAILVQKIQKIDFDANGFLKSAYVKKDSELLAASKVPLAIMTAISSALPLRLTIQQKQVELAQKRVAEAQAKRQLMETRATGGVVKDAQ